MYILGIDGSLRSTGVCLLNPKGEVEWTRHLLTYDLRGMARLKYLTKILSEILECKANHVGLVVLENYAMGIKSGMSFSIGELGYAIKKVLYDKGIKTIIVTPSSMKKFVTGRGNAKKHQIQESLLLKWNMDIPQEDEADSVGLALFGYYLNHLRLQRQLEEPERDALRAYEILQ